MHCNGAILSLKCTECKCPNESLFNKKNWIIAETRLRALNKMSIAMRIKWYWARSPLKCENYSERAHLLHNNNTINGFIHFFLCASHRIQNFKDGSNWSALRCFHLHNASLEHLMLTIKTSMHSHFIIFKDIFHVHLLVAFSSFALFRCVANDLKAFG